MENSSNQMENQNGEISLKKYLNILLIEKKLIICLTLIASIIGVTYSLIKKPVWRGEFKIVTKENNSSQNSNSILSNNPLSSLVGIKKTFDNKTTLEILNSQSVLKPVYEFAKKNDPKLNLSYKKWVNQKLFVKYELGTEVLVASYIDENKKLLLSILHEIKNKYQEYSVSSRKNNLSQSIKFLTNQQKVLSGKYQKSLAEFNKFTIDNGLGNIDGVFSLDDSSRKGSNQSPLLNQNTQNFPDFTPQAYNEFSTQREKSEGIPIAQRYAIQFANLESKEALYNQLSTLLKPNSQTIIELSKEIESLKKSLKRPNEILIKYRDLQSTAERNKLLLYNISENLELAKLEQVKQLIPWQVISPPTINELRESPKRKQIVLISFLAGLFLSSIISVVKHNKKGIVFEKEDFEKYLDIKFDGYVGEDINLNTLFIKKFKENLNKGEYLGILKLEDNDSDNSKYFQKDSKIKFISVEKLEELENFRNILLIAYSGRIKIKTLDKIKEYLKVYKNNIKGSFLTNS